METPQIDPAASDLAVDGGVLDPLDYARYALGAVRRRWYLAVAVFLAGLALAYTYWVTATPRYRAETRILAQRQQALPAMVRSSLAEDQPTRAAWELIHRRDNLVELIKHAKLLEGKPADAASWLDRLGARFGSTRPDEDPLDELVLLLDKRLKVETGDVTIAIELDWPDPQQAYQIVDGALQNFLEARHVQEVTALDEAIAILRGRAETLRGELDQAIAEESRSATTSAPRGARAQASPPSPPAQSSEELVRIKSMLDAKQRAIADVEDFRRRRLAELTAQYDSRRAIYTENHPESVTLRQDITALTRDSPQLSALRAEEKQLREEYQARLAREPAPRTVGQPVGDRARGAATEHPRSRAESERVREARRRCDDVLDSVNRAQVDLDAARSAFNHRYKIIWPVQLPKKPVSPNPLKVFGIGGLASLFLALLAAVVRDWRAGKVQERWQIERDLGVPIVGEVPRGG